MRLVLSLGAVAVAAAALAAVGGGAGLPDDPTSPAWSPDDAAVAFAYVDSSTFRIEAASASGVRPLYTGRNVSGCCDPMQWAAGGRILYVENFTLTSLPVTGGRPKRLFSSTPWYVLSPNRETTAVTDGCGCGHAPDAVAFVNVAGGTPIVVPKPSKATDEIDGFSPDGTELVFTRYPAEPGGTWGPGRLMAVHVGGGVPVPLARSGLIGAGLLPAGADAVQWSPDGRWIAFVRALRLQVVSTAGGAPRVLATHFGADAYAWSPDSAHIAYDCCSNHPSQELTTVDPDGTHRTVLGSQDKLRYISEDSLDRPQWSADSSTLAFMARAGQGSTPIHLWVARADGTGLHRVA